MVRSKAVNENYLVRSLAKGLEVLECTLRHNDPCRLTDIAESLDFDLSTALRYCATLEHLGYLYQEPSMKTYNLGPRAFDLAYTIFGRLDLRSAIGSWLQLLATEFNGSASMAVLRGANAVYVDRAVSKEALTYSIPIGASLPAYKTSIGHALLAQLSDNELITTFEQIRSESPDFSSNDADRLGKELQVTRKRGYALNIEGFRRGLCSVAVPLKEPLTNTLLGGINVAGYSYDMTRERLEKEIAPLLIDVVRRITRNEFAPRSLSELSVVSRDAGG
jgi:IclR family pca regulon transcriptional regulator